VLALAPSPRRLSAAFLALAVVLGLFGVRLVYAQGVWAAKYSSQASEERTLQISLPSTRGPILDTNGVPLATTVDAVNVVVDQRALSNPAAAALQLSSLLGRDPARLQQDLTGDELYWRLKRDVDGATWAKIRDLGITGIYSEPSVERAYPAGDVAGNIIGFIGHDEQQGPDDPKAGQFGLEQSYEDVLAGQPGSLRYERDAGGRAIPLADQTRVDPVPGRGLRLTIDRDIQWFAEQVLSAKVKEAAAVAGSAIVLDPRTGDILAFAEAPHVDPANPAASDEEDRGSRAIAETYEPGSVQKPLTMAAAVDSGAVDPDDVFLVPDSIPREGWPQPINDFAPHEDWQLTPAGILAKSSNVGTIKVAERMDKDVMRDYLVKFGYADPPGIGMPNESASLPENWSDLRRDTISYGQGVATTIVQLASAYGAIANDGLRMPARLVDAIVDPDGTERLVPHTEPVQVVRPETAQDVTTMMEAVVADGGTASNVVVDGYRLAAKTGTAEILNAAGQVVGYDATFAGFAPADDPQLVVVVSIHKPKQGRYGGQLGGPVFADIMDFTLPRLGIPPSGAAAPKVAIFGDEQ
jgi:cell division protein FtsI (penicillin-binding protein 3)